MKYIKLIIYILPLIIYAQSKKNIDSLNFINNKKIEEAKSIDFIKYKYKNLDKNFKIKTNKEKFDLFVKKYKFYNERITSYSDSLSVVLTAEFDSFHHSRIAQLQLTYTWERVSYHIWESTITLKDIAKKNNIKHPYYFKKMLENENLKSKDLILLINKLKTKLKLIYGEDKIESIKNNKDLLNFAFKNNPEVKILKETTMINSKIQKFKLKHKREPTHEEQKKLGVSCGKENCCQIIK